MSGSAYTAVTGTTEASPRPKKQRYGNNDGPTNNPPSNDPLWALLSAFAEAGPRGVGTLAAESAAKRAAAPAATAVTGTVARESRTVIGSRLSLRHPAGAGAATAATLEGVGAGAVGTSHAPPAASDGPLVVSVVATLRSGDARYQEEKALLEVKISKVSSAASFPRLQSRPTSLAGFESPRVFHLWQGLPVIACLSLFPFPLEPPRAAFPLKSLSSPVSCSYLVRWVLG